MSFAWPQLFWLLLVPAALLVLELLRRRRSPEVIHPKILHAEAGANHLSFVASPTRRNRARWWLCAGLVLCITALTRPQWGRIEEPVFDQAREILIAIDLSRSMLSQDVRPSRLDRAKLLTQSLLEKLNGERVGLVSFAGTAFLQSPLSSDYEILREFLPAMGPDFLPEGGTNYRALLETSLAAFGTGTADRYLIVLSDGEATDDDWQSAAAELKKKNVRVISLGIGTASGAMIPDGAGAFVKDERGAVVLSKLESNTLQELANTTGGTYRDASTWLDLAGVLSATVEAGQKGKFLEKNTVRLVERFQWPLALGLWCLLVSFCYEFPVRPRPRDLRLAPATRRVSAPARPTVAALLIGGLFAAALAFPTTLRAVADPAAPLARIVGRLSAKNDRSARDWAELARETVSWGQHIQDDQKQVPEGPVRDALSAVELGAKQDAKAADWPKLRENLEALLQKPEQRKQDQQQQNQPQQNQDQKDQQQKQSDQQDQQKQDPSKQDSQGNPQQQKDQQSQHDQQNQKQDASEKKDGQSAFGDMQQPHNPPQPPSQETQKVGGVPEKKDGEKTPADPALALPLQKLDQLRNQDSPAQLFQLMDGDKKTAAPKKKGKDW
jgi:Ca-activated chloride channel family protein